MKPNNYWLSISQQEVKVNLKRMVFNGTINNKSYTHKAFDAVTGQKLYISDHDHCLDVEHGNPKSITVKINRYGSSYKEKLAIVIQAALKEFNDDLNRYSLSCHLGSLYAKSADEPEIVIDPKFLKWINGETHTAYLDKDHKIQYEPQGNK